MIGKGAVTHFHGIYIGHAVIVRDRAEIEELWASGSYGKARMICNVVSHLITG